MAAYKLKFSSRKILEWGGLGFFALLPHVFSLTAFENFRIPKDAFSSAFIILLAVFFLLTQPFWPKHRPQTVVLLWGAGMVYLVLHTLVLGSPDVSWPAVRQLFLFSALWLMLIQLLDDQVQRRVWLVLGLSMGLNAVIAVLQSLGQFPLMMRASGQGLAGRITPAGMIGDVNSGGFLFGLTVLMCLYFVAFEKRLRVRMLWASLVALNLVGLLATRTLTALGGLALCLAIGLVFHHWWEWKRAKEGLGRLAKLWAALLPSLAAAGLVAYQLGVVDRVLSRIQQTPFRGLDFLLSGRWPTFLITWSMIREAPLWGRGLEAFAQDFFYARTDTEFGQQFVIRGAGSFQQVHNEFLQIWLELGLIPLVLFLAIWVIPVWRAAVRAISSPDQRTSYWLMVQSLAGVFVLISCLTFFPFHVSSTAAAAILVLAGLVKPGESFAGRSLAQLAAGRRVLRYAAGGLIILVGILMMSYPVSTWRANRELGISAFLLEQARSSDPRRQRFLADEAASRLDRAHQLAPQIQEYWSLRGSAATLMGRYQEALRFYAEAARRLPSPEVLTNLAVACMGVRDYDSARKHLEQALRYNPRYAAALKALKALPDPASGSTR